VTDRQRDGHTELVKQYRAVSSLTRDEVTVVYKQPWARVSE